MPPTLVRHISAVKADGKASVISPSIRRVGELGGRQSMYGLPPPGIGILFSGESVLKHAEIP